MKRKLTLLLCTMMLLCMCFSFAHAKDSADQFSFRLTVNGSGSSAAIKVGDVVTVAVKVACLDPEGTDPVATVQDEIQYDSRLFELVEGSVVCADGFVSGRGTAQNGIQKVVKLSRVSSVAEGIALPSVQDLGTFQLKAIAAGATSLNHINYKVVKLSGKEVFASTGEHVEVNITSTAGPNPGGSGSVGGNGGSGKSAVEQQVPTDKLPLSVSPFEDVKENHWSYAYVKYLAEKGYVTGKSSTVFAPSDAITRAEFITILARMSGDPLPNGYGGAFTDVSSGAYYERAVAWGVNAGVIKGTSETSFSPNKQILRQEMASMIVRYAQFKSYQFPQTQGVVTFTDQTQVHEYAREAVGTMQQADILGGYEDGSFRPLHHATRAETAKMLTLVQQLMIGTEK